MRFATLNLLRVLGTQIDDDNKLAADIQSALLDHTTYRRQLGHTTLTIERSTE